MPPSSDQSLAPPRQLGPLRIALIYAVVSALWILFSDQLLQHLLGESEVAKLTWLQTLKGWFFITATAVLLYGLVSASLRRLRASQQALGQSETRYRYILETAEEGVWIVDRQLDTTFINARAAEILGSTPDQLLGRKILDLTHPDDRGLLQQQLERCRLGRKGHYDLRLRHTAGHCVWAMVTSNPLYDEQGQFTGWLAMVSDISQRKATEEALRHSEERFRLLVEGARDYCFCLLDADGRIIFWNQGAQRLTGYAAEQVLHGSFVSVFCQEGCRCLDEARDKGTSRSQAKVRRPDGSSFWTQRMVTALPGEAGRPRGFAVLIQDISESRRAQESLRQGNARFAAVFENSGLGILLSNPDGRFIDANPAAQNMLGRSREELLALRFTDITHPDDLDGSVADFRATRDGSDVRRQIVKRVLRKDGQAIWVRRTVTAVCDTAGQVQYLIGMLEDVTERRIAREQIQQLNATLEQRVTERTAQLEQAYHEMEAFGDTISRELRAPLASIQAFAGTLLRDHASALGEAGQEDARRIVGGAARLHGMIEDLLDYSRAARTAQAPQRLSLALVVHETLGRIERDFANLTPGFVVSGALPDVLGHRVTLSHVVYYLLCSALAPTTSHTPKLRVWAESRAGRVRLCVQDTAATDPAPVDVCPSADPVQQQIRRDLVRMAGQIGKDFDPPNPPRFWLELPLA